MKIKVVLILSMIIFVIDCKDKRNLDPIEISQDSMKAIYAESPFENKKATNAYPVCMEYWFKGELADVKKAFEMTMSLIQLFGGKNIESCSQFKSKAMSGCVLDTTDKKFLSDESAFKNIKRAYIATYYLGSDIENAKIHCKSTNPESRFIDFTVK
ncbi:MAG TPA: hypothetical protein PKL30_26760 [Leptospiraceae bacterium]|nr:hypothetical protein [Leptospiraceae bacterium]